MRKTILNIINTSQLCSAVHVNKYASSKATQRTVDIDIEQHKAKLMARGLPKIKAIDGVNQIVLVSSGKGGVGKSTVAVNVATSLKLLHPQKNIGLLDADVFGPCIPLMMNLRGPPLVTEDGLMEPLTNYGVKCMSMGFLISESSPVIWRGLMVMQALDRLMRKVAWGSIDYLIIDTPPGTGDIQLSLAQNIPIAGTILVTTPQSAAIHVTRRGAFMFQKLGIPIIGLVENMSSVKCPSCLSNVPLFGTATTDLASAFSISVLQKIPLQQDISTSMDKGVPIVIGKPNSEEAAAYKNIAEKVVQYLEKN